MLIRNKEERTDSIWRFVAITTIPLLLLFLAGFSIGNTSGREKTANRQKLEEAEKKIADLEASLLARDSFFRRGDAILSKVEEKAGEFDKDLRAMAGQITEDDQLLAAWESDVNKYFKLVSRDLDNLEIDFSDKDKTLATPLQIGQHYFQEYLQMHRNFLLMQERMTVGKAKEGKVDDLSKIQSDLEKQKEDFQKESEAQKGELKIMSLQTQLDKCKEDLARLNQSAANSKSPNPTYKAKILSEVDAIRNEIVPNMRTTFIGNDSKKIGPLRDKLSEKLIIIGENANRIE